jgi:hypothetical protein
MIFNTAGTTLRKNTRKEIFILLLLFTCSSVIYSQKVKEEVPPLRERMFFGGSFGLQFGSITDIQVSPVVGLWLLPRLAVALGPDYRFYKDHYNTTNIYGGKGYVQFVVIKNINSFIPLGSNTGIFLHCEDDLLSLESSFWKYPPYKSDRFYINTILAGGGISQQIGRRSSLNFIVLWALNDSGYGVYGNPEIRVSFTF